MPVNNFNIHGLSNDEVLASREKYGHNRLDYKKESGLAAAIKSLAKEPMVLLLIVASAMYFVNGQSGDGIFMAVSIVLISVISLYQDSRSRNALEKLKSFTQANSKVIRNGKTEEISSEELVIGDQLIVEEGTSIPADGIIIHSNDFSVNESILTGESLSVYKDKDKENNFIYSGTTVNSGLAIATVSAIGNATKLGKIGKSLEGIAEEKTPLEKQINNFVKKMVIPGALIFLIVWAINYSLSEDISGSLLQALTLAMSILPEEIPVAFTTFMALGAWRLMKMGIVVKQMKTVETLGSATVICVDKTGTITENKMELAKVYLFSSDKIYEVKSEDGAEIKSLIRTAMWASEPIPFDPMEIALHDSYASLHITDERETYKLIHEYPLSGQPPMMTHIFRNEDGDLIVAAKGAPEAMIRATDLSLAEIETITAAIDAFSAEGYRVLGVGEAVFEGDIYPDEQIKFPFTFRGLLAFYDPPKQNMKKVLQDFYSAGIAVKIVTGDNALTTAAIAKQINFRGASSGISGEDFLKLTDEAAEKTILNTHVFTRMFPEAKLKLINALKSKGEIVAMTGDGVNDGPALKAAHIGIAMGKKGTEIAKQAASLILTDDDLSKMVEAVAMGRKIYSNLKKAIQYIISIHIPIILTVFLPLALGWVYPYIFSPVHIIFLELIMGPTCSIIYENEPMEANTMQQQPRPYSSTFFNRKELFTSILQGLAITAGTLFTYQYAIAQHYNEAVTRTMLFTVLIAANIFLTLVNRSFFYSVFSTLKYRNPLVLAIISITLAITALLLFLPPLTAFFGFEPLQLSQFAFSGMTGLLCVIWYEGIKGIKRKRQRIFFGRK